MIGALSLATDLGLGVPLEYGLHSTLIGLRLCAHLGVDAATASQTYYACLLFYVGCTADADVAADLFGEDNALTTYATPARFGSRAEMIGGILRAVAPPTGSPTTRARQLARGVPKVVSTFRHHIAAFCEVARMLTDRVGLPAPMPGLLAHVAERWDGKGEPGRVSRDAIPLAVRIAQVARDAAFQRMLGGDDFAAGVVRRRAGRAFDPAVARALADNAAQMLALDGGRPAWDATMAGEPAPHVLLGDEQVDEALAAMGDFADLVSPYLVGHSASVADVAARAAVHSGLEPSAVVAVRRAAQVHDIGRVAVPARTWQQEGPLSPDDWEHVRLHAYHTERVLSRSPFLAALTPVAGAHHERLDGSGYHRGSAAAALSRAARLLATADAYCSLTEPRAHRPAVAASEAARLLGDEANAGRLDTDAVAAVLKAVGEPVPRLDRPAGLTDREAEVIGLIARGLQTKQIARVLGISAKTADHHIQNSYAKIGVSSRAAATLFAMQHGLTAWGELPISRPARRS